MKLTSPTNVRHRFTCHCFGPNGILYKFSSAVSGRHDFEVEDIVIGVIYTSCNSGDNKQGQQWVWDGERWLDLDSTNGADVLTKLKDPIVKAKAAAKAAAKVAKKADPKPANTKEWTVKDREDAVVKSFKKVTKEL